ncbi:MAG TPA: SapC family protein [Steroidobacteraceae bacterium]|nr:SapC family protein [Steroidobacteraceae bacterium]
MTRIVALNREAHRALTVDGRASAAYGDNQRIAEVTVKEFPLLVVHYPILFSKDPRTGRFYCGAMLGFDEGENLFLTEWQQRDCYRPLSLQRGPFYAQGEELAIDLEHPRVLAQGGQRLFTELGQPTRYLQSIIWAFQDLKPGLEMTRVFSARLLQLKLIEPLELEMEFDDGTLRYCIGLYTINQDVLARLPEQVVVELFRRGYLRLIHLMIASLKQVPVLARRKNARLLGGTEALAGVQVPLAG